jgi:outer membrane protein insertion porin family
MHSYSIMKVRGRVALATLLGLAIASLGMAPSASAQEPTPEAAAEPLMVRLESVSVRGNQRVQDATILNLAALRPGTYVTGLEVQEAIGRIMASGNFDNVEVYGSGDLAQGSAALVIEVSERPWISQIDFRGLERIKGSTVRDTLGLTANQPLNPNVVTRTEAMIRDLLGRQGVQVVSIDTVMTPVTQPAGAFRLTFDVREGNRLSIADVRFEGNSAFADGRLHEVLRTRPEGFLWFRSGRFDPETFREDLAQRLPQFYARNGYIDFAVLSDTMEIDPVSGKARIVIRMSEGPQYRLGEFDIEGNTHFPTESLTRVFTTQRRSVLGLPFGRSDERAAGEVFDRSAMDAAAQRVGQMYRNEGFLYAQVEPVLERVPAATPGESPVVNVRMAVSEHQPFYIRRVAIRGNTNTHESVIRDRLFVVPGDVYNEDRLIQSYQSIGGLGFFEAPLPMPSIDPNPETGEVDITFHVKEKQTGSFNFGTMLGGYRGTGLSGFVGFTQPNLFGQAKQAELQAEYGWGRSSFRGTYTDPALLGSRNSGTVSLFHQGDRFIQFDDGNRTVTGASLRYGMPVPGMRWARAFVGYQLSHTTLRSNIECSPGELSIFCLPSSTASTASLGLSRDTRNHPLFPTVGTRQTVNVAQTGGPLGGDGNFQKVTSELDWWVPVAAFGASQGGQRPIRTSVGLQARTGAVFGDAERFPFERFFLGGTQWGMPLRGYEERTITPFGYSPMRGGELQSMQRLGDAYLSVTGEYAIRFSDAISISAFAEAGNIWGSAWEINPTQLFRSTGVGLTIMTPFGPMGMDMAYGFDKPEPGWQFHFKVGQGF